MGVGKPVVSFDFDEIRKITGNAGLLAQPGDLNEFIELIEYLINNKKERELLGSRGRTLALKEYDWKTRAEETVKIYETVI